MELCSWREEVQISHLQSADDTILGRSKFEKFVDRTRCLSTVPGLKNKEGKCSAGITIHRNEQELAMALGCEVGKWPIKNFRVPLGSRDLLGCNGGRGGEKDKCWEQSQFIQMQRIKISQSALCNKSIYYLSHYRIPVNVAKRVESFQRNFSWEEEHLRRKKRKPFG